MKNRLFIISAAFITLILLDLFHVKHLNIALYQSIKWLEFFLILLYIKVNFKNLKDFDIALAVLFLSAVLQAILGWVQFGVQHSLGLRFIGEYISPFGTPGLATIDTAGGKLIRAYGTFPHPNVLAGFLLLGILCGLYFVSYGTKKVKIWSAIGLVILLIGIFTTFSRIAWVSAALILLIFGIWYFIKQQRTNLFALVAIIIVSCATIFSFYSSSLKARTADRDQTSVEDRYYFNKLGLETFNQFPIFGVGVGNYITKLIVQYQLEPWQYQPPHNILIYILVELGIVGLGLFLFLLKELFVAFKNIAFDHLTLTLLTAGAIILLVGQFDHYFVTIQQGRLMFATVLGLIAALPNLYDHKKSY